MNSKNLKDTVFYAVLFLTWFLSGMGMPVHLETAVMFVAFVLSVSTYFYVKNVRIKTVVLALLTVAAGIYTYEYVIFYIPVLLLIAIYEGSERKQNKKIKDTCTMIYVALMLFKIPYTVFCHIDSVGYVNGRFTFYIKVASLIIAFFVLLLIISEKSEGKMKKSKQNRRSSIYILSLIGIFQDVVLLAIKNSLGVLQAAQFDFMAWFVFVLCIMYFKDASFEKAVNFLNNKTERFLGIER